MSNGSMNHSGVTIGQAAAQFGLAPSTLRWWESQGVLPPPTRINRRRVYDENELRRIGLAYLCCVTGGMPLEKASLVTRGVHNESWQGPVREHARAIEQKIERLQSARDYLLHLLQCPDDDMVTQCPHLDDELRRHIPAKAENDRDEISTRYDETPELTVRCAVCADAVVQPPRGRRRKYCSRACQQRHYRQNGGV